MNYDDSTGAVPIYAAIVNDNSTAYNAPFDPYEIKPIYPGYIMTPPDPWYTTATDNQEMSHDKELTKIIFTLLKSLIFNKNFNLIDSVLKQINIENSSKSFLVGILRICEENRVQLQQYELFLNNVEEFLGDEAEIWLVGLI